MNIKTAIKRLLSSPVTTPGEKESFVLQQFEIFKKNNDNRFKPNKEDLLLCVKDIINTKDFDSHYMYHLACAARDGSFVQDTDPAKVKKQSYACGCY